MRISFPHPQPYYSGAKQTDRVIEKTAELWSPEIEPWTWPFPWSASSELASNLYLKMGAVSAWDLQCSMSDWRIIPVTTCFLLGKFWLFSTIESFCLLLCSVHEAGCQECKPKRRRLVIAGTDSLLRPFPRVADPLYFQVTDNLKPEITFYQLILESMNQIGSVWLIWGPNMEYHLPESLGVCKPISNARPDDVCSK